MSRKQMLWYFAEWKLACQARGWKTSDDQQRYALHRAALGSDISSKNLTDPQLDLVIAQFRAVSRPNSVNSQLRQIEQPRTRLLWKIQVELAAILRLYGHEPEPYILSVIADKFPARRQRVTMAMSGHGPLGLDELLSDISSNPSHPDRPSELEQLLITLTARTDHMRQEAEHTKRQMIRLSLLYRDTPELAPVSDDNPF